MKPRRNGVATESVCETKQACCKYQTTEHCCGLPKAGWKGPADITATFLDQQRRKAPPALDAASWIGALRGHTGVQIWEEASVPWLF